jgi:vacuolar-type H+-ATPase subunit C/Vma6
VRQSFAMYGAVGEKYSIFRLRTKLSGISLSYHKTYSNVATKIKSSVHNIIKENLGNNYFSFWFEIVEKKQKIVDFIYPFGIHNIASISSAKKEGPLWS